jgi:hypothetical protein
VVRAGIFEKPHFCAPVARYRQQSGSGRGFEKLIAGFEPSHCPGVQFGKFLLKLDLLIQKPLFFAKVFDFLVLVVLVLPSVCFSS